MCKLAWSDGSWLLSGNRKDVIIASYCIFRVKWRGKGSRRCFTLSILVERHISRGNDSSISLCSVSNLSAVESLSMVRSSSMILGFI